MQFFKFSEIILCITALFQHNHFRFLKQPHSLVLPYLMLLVNIFYIQKETKHSLNLTTPPRIIFKNILEITAILDELILLIKYLEAKTYSLPKTPSRISFATSYAFQHSLSLGPPMQRSRLSGRVTSHSMISGISSFP